MRGIVFEGCACRAAFHAGVAAALTEGGVVFDRAAGASSGSVVAAGVAAGRGTDLPSLWLGAVGRSIVSFRRALHNRSIFDMSSIVRNALRATLGDGDLRRHPVEALASVTRLADLRPMIVSSHETADFVEAVLGSSFFPVFYGRTVRINGALVLDGGLFDNLPIEALAARGCDDIFAVLSRPRDFAVKKPWQRRWKPVARGARVHLLRPRQPLAVTSWDLDRGRALHAIDEGYAVGREFLGH